MSHVQLDEKDYQQILAKRFVTKLPVKFVKATLKPLSEDVQGFMGEHYKLEITYKYENAKEEIEKFFLKRKPISNQIQRQITEESEFYTLEVFMYSYIFQEFEKYGFDISFSPKCFYSIGEELMVFEDMSEKGFEVSKRGKFYDLAQCKCGFNSLALLHAAGWMYEDVKSKETGRRYNIQEEFPDIFKEKLLTFFTEFKNKVGEEWFKITLDIFCKLVDYLPESEEYKSEFKRRLLEKEIGRIFIDETGIKKTTTHGDLWMNNMLFKIENGEATKCSLVDYQLARYFYPSYDVLLFLQMNCDADFRQQYREELCRYYYETLSKILAERGYSVEDFYPMKDYEESLKIVEYETKIQAYALKAFVRLPIEILTKGVNDDDGGLTKLLLEDRIGLTLKAFLNDESYRKFVTDDLYELGQTLFEE